MLTVEDATVTPPRSIWIALAAIAGCASPAPPDVRPPPAPPPPVPAPQPIVVARAPVDDCQPLAVSLPSVAHDPADPATIPPIVDAQVLDPFFESVARVLRKRADDHVRIAVYGDSNLTMDFMTGQMRRRLQLEHGDAGHGFVALGRPWSHYLHMDVRHDVKRGFVSYACSTDPALDRIYGISGIAAESIASGAKSWVATATDDAPIGHNASRAEVFYARGKKRGTFEISVDGELERSVDSHDSDVGLGVERIEMEDGAHTISIEATDRRHRIRLLGLTLERDVPASFVIDAFGVGAMNTRSQAMQHSGINHEMLKHRGYDLIIFATGANDVFTLDVTPKHLSDLIALQRSALPGVPILLLTPADRGREETFPPTLSAIEQRRALAKDNHTALWDMWLAMGGHNAMRSFKQRGLAASDYIHFTQAGGAWVGDRLLFALWRELEAYLAAHPRAGCDGDGKPAGSGVATPM
jgi:hypothetical protein